MRLSILDEFVGFAGAFETQWLAAPKNFAGEAGKKVEDLIAGRFNRKGERCRKCSMAKGKQVEIGGVRRRRGHLQHTDTIEPAGILCACRLDMVQRG